jgi:hypothetical protein
MDGTRFDDLTRSLASTPSRRTVARLLVGSALGLLGSVGGAETEAHNALTKCKKIDNKRKRKHCLRRARAHNAEHNAELEFPGTCTPEQEDLCQNGDFAAANCNDTPGCSCYTTARGARFCGTDAASFDPDPGAGCQKNADCGPGAACVQALTDNCSGSGTPNTFCIKTCTRVQTCGGEDRCADRTHAVVCGGIVGDELQTCFCLTTAATGDPVCAQFDPERIGTCSPATPCPDGRICVACPAGAECFLPCAHPFA